MGKSFFAVIATIAMAGVLSGCATLPKQEFNRAANQNIKSITLLEPAGTDEYQVRDLGHIGNSFGLIGALIAEADIASKSHRFTSAMVGKDYHVLEEFRDTLKTALEKDGYIVHVVPVKRGQPDDFLEKYNAVASDDDAILDTAVSSGYLCATMTTDYIPYVRADVRLVKRTSGEILYREIVSYGYEIPYDQHNNAVSIAAKGDYAFNDFDALTASTDKALAGMREGLPLVVQQVAHDLAPAHAAQQAQSDVDPTP